MQTQRLVATTSTISTDVPTGKRIPFGWSAVAIPASHDGSQVLSFHDSAPGKIPETAGYVAFRLAVALDVRDERLVEVRSARSGRLIGVLDIRYAPVFQVHSIEMSRKEGALLLQDGLALSMTRGEAPLWAFAVRTAATDPSDVTDSNPPEVLQPHLLVSEQDRCTTERFLESFCSIGSVQSFGWEEGCVLDGLYDLAAGGQARARSALETHLSLFFGSDGSLTFESPRSDPVENRLTTIENTLPFAILGRTAPEHPAIAIATDFWNESLSEDGRIQDSDLVSAEGSYTVAYPLASVASSRRDSSAMLLARTALAELRRRRDCLTHGDDLSLRRYDDGRLTFTNWARAYAWYLLGLVRTLAIVEPLTGLDTTDLEAEYRRVASIALEKRLSNGLWSCFVDDADTGVETSGSAGIAAALAIGARMGIGDDAHTQAAYTALTELLSFLTPDGMLGGVSQSNRGGEPLQRSGYRVLSPMASGLLAQLMAGLS